MTAPPRRHLGLRLCALLIAILPLLSMLGCTLQQYPQSTLHPQSEYAGWIQDLLESLVFWVVLIFVVVEAALIVAVIRFRSRPGMPDPRPVHGHTGLEIAWTIAPALILAVVAVPTVATIFRTQSAAPPNALQIQVIGHQWWWEFRYPQLNFTTANEMHVPVGRAVDLTLESADVLHSFWFPAVGGKRDVVPSRKNRMWFTASTVGTFPGQCAELCGTSHANMRMKLMVDPQEQFDAWVAAQQAGPTEPDSAVAQAVRGKQVFLQAGCVACHTIRGVSAGVLGPDLTHVGARTTLAAGMWENTPEHMARWIEDPPARKPGTTMLKLNLARDQIADLVVYLQALK
jgi:cytochrome c oxidase subunit 2